MFDFLWKSVLSPRFRINPDEVSFQRRGFYLSDPSRKSHLEAVGSHFLFGYHLALSKPMHSLDSELKQLPSEYQGFAYEGAAMLLALLDSVSIGKRNRWREFTEGPGSAHHYVSHVGYGWVLACLPWGYRFPERYLSNLDPLLRWLVIDGLGFHEGYFHGKKWLPPSSRRVPWKGYVARAFDQGLGRSLWFVGGADVTQIAKTVASFPVARRADLWSGVGLACSYAGSPSVSDLEYLIAAAECHSVDLGQGVVFGAEARELAGIQTDHTELACQVVCGLSASEAAKLTYVAKQKPLVDCNESPAYEKWRANIRALLRSVNSKQLSVK